MATLRSKAQVLVGSTQWIVDERDQISQFSNQEAEDFAFSARNEVEWLNEHMADIFSKNQVNVTEIFKTPGKLRGKTPRTTRKRNPLEGRAPLTDIFSTNIMPNSSPSHDTNFYKEVAKFQVAEDTIAPSVQVKTGKGNTDSGYHGMTEDEMDIDEVHTVITPSSGTQVAPEAKQDVSPNPPAKSQTHKSGHSEDRSPTEKSFHSAKEDITNREIPPSAPNAATRNDEGHLVSTKYVAVLPQQRVDKSPSPHHITTHSPIQKHPVHEIMEIDGNHHESMLEEDHDIDGSHTPSQGSSPAKPLIRKVSLTFASLPPRPPLATKRSIGGRESRTSHLDQSKPNIINRGSFLGRYTGGKSQGSLRKPETETTEDEGKDDEMDVDDAEMPIPAREESDGDTKISRLHNQSSTQRLHDRINMLGKAQPARPTKSISTTFAVPQPSYPELPISTVEEPRFSEQAFSETAFSDTSNNFEIHAIDDDDDDWIQPPTFHANGLERPERPQLFKSTSADVMEQIRGKDSIGGKDFGLIPHERNTAKPPSPLRQLVKQDCQSNGSRHSKSASTSALSPPLKNGKDVEARHQKTISVSNPALASVPGIGHPLHHANPVIGSPSTKRYADGPLSASKSKLQSIMKTARGLFTSSAGVSAQAKMETLSPHSMRTRGQAHESRMMETLNNEPGPLEVTEHLYPELHRSQQPNSATTEYSKSPSKPAESRKTRSSTEKEEKKRDKEAKQRQRADEHLDRAREKERQRIAVQKVGQAPISLAKNVENPDLGDAASLTTEQSSKPTRQSPRRLQNQPEAKKGLDTREDMSDMGGPAQPMGPPLPYPQVQASQIQKPKDLRRPIKPAKEIAPKPKPQPVAIRVGFPQRIPLTNAALSSSLQESLPPPLPKQPGVAKKASNASLQTSVSNSSQKSSVTSATSKPKALLAAERKKEQDDKEAQRKFDQKREIERKRAAQQEEYRHQEQMQRQEVERQRERERAAAAEDPKKTAQKQAIEKRRLEMGKKDQQRMTQRPPNDAQEKLQAPTTQHRGELGGARPASRLNTVQDYSRTTTNHHAPNPGKAPIKRVFDPDIDDESVRPVRVPAGPSYQQSDAKRRRTENEDVQETNVRPTMAPPIRKSNIRKDVLKSTIFSNGYTTVAPSAGIHHNASSMQKASTVNQVYPQQHQHQNQGPRSAYPVDMAKYTNGKIPFAEASNPPQHFPNGDNIHLEEIPTDSEDEDSEDDKAKNKGSNFAEWVQSPNLRQILMEQENQNADDIFGPVGSPHMEEMFKDKNRHHRFRARTSSANWNGPDRLTEEEIRNDIAGRDKMRKDGGWTFGL